MGDFDGKTFFFVNPDVKRGMFPCRFDYSVICSFSEDSVNVLRRSGIKVWVAEENGLDPEKLNNSGKLLQEEKVKEHIRKSSKYKPHIIFFKPSKKLDKIINESGYGKIGNSSWQNEFFENKVSGFGALREVIPKNSIEGFTVKTRDIDFHKTSEILSLPFVLQFGYGWAGKNTYFISKESDMDALKAARPETWCKVTRFVSGFSILNNCVVTDEQILVGPPAAQISGIESLYPSPFVTCGRQWPAQLEKKQTDEIRNLSIKVGDAMKKRGYRGFFGLDFILDSNTGRIFVAEINARLTASSPFYSHIEKSDGNLCLFEHHILSFFGKTSGGNIEEDIKAAQLILRFAGPGIKTGKSYLKSLSGRVTEDFSYSPGKMSDYEYIYLKNREHDQYKPDTETGRLESKMQAVSGSKLLSWARSAIFLKSEDINDKNK